jgi:hypothetical protein
MMKARLLIMIVFTGLITTCFGQQSADWDKWNWLTGEWVGEGSGQPGKGGGYFSFKTDLDNNVMIRKGHTEIAAGNGSPKSIHDDLMIVYKDNTAAPSRAIYFDNEGHTINYQVAYADKSIILTSEKVEGMPVFRLTYTLLDNQTVNTKFEMSQDNITFSTYIEGKSKKMK